MDKNLSTSQDLFFIIIPYFIILVDGSIFSIVQVIIHPTKTNSQIDLTISQGYQKPHHNPNHRAVPLGDLLAHWLEIKRGVFHIYMVLQNSPH
ncbi:MAG: hypothetical protein IKA90_03725 [Clostridia bacterium]|nr:hypothetical protein [Clostridia bacterium]